MANMASANSQEKYVRQFDDWLINCMSVNPNHPTYQNFRSYTTSAIEIGSLAIPAYGAVRAGMKALQISSLAIQGEKIAGRLAVKNLNLTRNTRDFTTLYRAVKSIELTDIQMTGALRNLGSAEGKYFTTSPEAASYYAKQAVRGFGDPPYTLVEVQVSNTTFKGLSCVTVDRGIPAWVIPNERLAGLTPIIHDWMAIPK